MSPSMPSPLASQHSSGTPYTIANYENCDKFSARHKHFLTALSAETEPISYSQVHKYALNIISEVGPLGAQPASVPLEQNHRLALSTSSVLEDPECYRRLVGQLIYLCFTRSDLSYSVHVLSQFMTTPHEEHWEASLRVVEKEI
ncbi:retrovirus-related Pol polyprotein from transposon TNT 1-94 [Senna tora]|uniref:Retrovirus-related Pol polyprotein from transposon TNT 1-94 n=1 Tax=Senna tora TaxID=362788 RepID=A0A834SX91_9FABA|nr:retrovirus-related Pol polyprotein from transposon TNT 1-94 [Senna tora]